MVCQQDIPSDSLGAIWGTKYHLMLLIKNHLYPSVDDLPACKSASLQK